jgi:radical SAM/Cys-rich protein
MTRTNLTVFFENGLEWVPKWYRDHKVVIIASLPCYTEGNVDKQRGKGTFKRSIEAIKMLNSLGYGEGNLELDLVYNPGGEFLPGPQKELEADYKERLFEEYGVRFNSLFTITNAPIGRFKQYLEANGKLREYLDLLVRSFNADTAKGIMCRQLLSVDWRGVIYNCDFNQALDMAIMDSNGRCVTIDSVEDLLGGEIEIVTGEHCFCCTAGAGSSCRGSVVSDG